MTMHRVHFRNENVTIHVPDGSNLRDACLEHGVDPYPALGGLASCRSKGLCGTCVVQTPEPGSLSQPEKRERKALKKFDSSIEGLRLSCQAKVIDDLTVVTNPDMEPAWKTHGYYAGRFEHSWTRSE